MLFCSKEFIFYFLPVFLLIYYAVPKRFKNIVLFAGSIVFYALGEWKYVPLIILSLLVNYGIALIIEVYKQMEKKEHVICSKRKMFLLIAMLIYNFGLLFVFKYFKFFTGIESGLTLPLGISFYTFQIVSYVIDVYKDKTKAERNLINLGVYLCMFPQLIAGPIVLYTDVAKQIHNRSHSLDKFQDGIRTFTLGLGSKMIIANIMGMCWNSTQMYGIESISTPIAWIAMFAYTFQIYFDFYGYSLMAIGLGKMLGFTLPENFNDPYMATSVTDFWRRWHITLSTWFRDYVYIPLGGNRKGQVRTIFNMFVVWSLTGLWHGASWNFVIWGVIFFVLLTIEKLGFKKILDKSQALGHICMILVIPLSWVVFGLEKLSDIGIYFAKLFPFLTNMSFEYVSKNDYITALGRYWFFFILAILFSFSSPRKLYAKYKKTFLVTIILLAVFWVSIYRVFTSASNPFLYFRF